MISQGKPHPPPGRLAGSRHRLSGGCRTRPFEASPPCNIASCSSRSPACLVVLTASAPARSLEPLPYNNPGLAVDLGVGLWAWPLPCDADGDGDFDLVVSCPDKPSNGIYVFENATGDTSLDNSRVQAGPPDRRHRPLRHAQLRRRPDAGAHTRATSIPAFSPRASPRR